MRERCGGGRERPGHEGEVWRRRRKGQRRRREERVRERCGGGRRKSLRSCVKEEEDGTKEGEGR
eukprot:285980-Rhodomonas_salina.1